MRTIRVILQLLVLYGLVSFAYGYSGNTHGRFTSKAFKLLMNDYPGYAKYTYYNVFNQQQNYPEIDRKFDFRNPGIAGDTTNKLVYWGPDFYDDMKVQQAGFMKDLIPSKWRLDDTITLWITTEGVSGLSLLLPTLAFILWHWGPLPGVPALKENIKLSEKRGRKNRA